MKVFLVEHSAGQWSDHRTYISAIFDNRTDAESYAAKIKEYYQKIKSIEPPHNPEEYEKLSEPEYEELSAWQNKQYDADDFNCATVEEMEIGVVEKRFIE